MTPARNAPVADMSEAFALCRAADKPMRVEVIHGSWLEAWRVFPSGRADLLSVSHAPKEPDNA